MAAWHEQELLFAVLGLAGVTKRTCVHRKNDRCSVGPFLTLFCWPRATVVLLLLCARDRNERTFRAAPTHSSRVRFRTPAVCTLHPAA